MVGNKSNREYSVSIIPARGGWVNAPMLVIAWFQGFNHPSPRGAGSCGLYYEISAPRFQSSQPAGAGSFFFCQMDLHIVVSIIPARRGWVSLPIRMSWIMCEFQSSQPAGAGSAKEHNKIHKFYDYVCTFLPITHIHISNSKS